MCSLLINLIDVVILSWLQPAIDLLLTDFNCYGTLTKHHSFHSLLSRHSTASTTAMAKLSFATFIFDGQCHVVVQILRFLCVKG